MLPIGKHYSSTLQPAAPQGAGTGGPALLQEEVRRCQAARVFKARLREVTAGLFSSFNGFVPGPSVVEDLTTQLLNRGL